MSSSVSMSSSLGRVHSSRSSRVIFEADHRSAPISRARSVTWSAVRPAASLLSLSMRDRRRLLRGGELVTRSSLSCVSDVGPDLTAGRGFWDILLITNLEAGNLQGILSLIQRLVLHFWVGRVTMGLPDESRRPSQPAADMEVCALWRLDT